MSRIGKLPISVSEKVKITLTSDNAVFTGPKGTLSVPVPPGVNIEFVGNLITVLPNHKGIPKGSKLNANALHGLSRTLLSNAVIGVSEGFSRVLELNGVGYRASVTPGFLELTLGYSHPIKYEIPAGIEIKVDKQTIISISGPNKELVGLVAAKIRSFRAPEPYLGKGVKYQGEKIRRKAGKSGGK